METEKREGKNKRREERRGDRISFGDLFLLFVWRRNLELLWLIDPSPMFPHPISWHRRLSLRTSLSSLHWHYLLFRLSLRTTVSALAIAIGLQQGTQGSTFALAVVLSAVVMHDASGVRLHAGRQAELLNQIVCELPPEHPLSNARPLRELLGHTPPPQVAAGAVLGCIVSYLMTSSG